MSAIRYSYLLLAFSVFFIACERENINLYQDEPVLLPAGRSFLGESSISITIDGQEVIPEIQYDSSGGFWMMLRRDRLSSGSELRIEYSRTSETLQLFQGPDTDKTRWLDPAPYIDSDNDSLVLVAASLTDGISGHADKARQIADFIAAHMEYRIYPSSFLDNASTAYANGYGTCMNFSRLYVALCRAGGIPARTVWGVIYGDGVNHLYDSHHQWAEIMDEQGFWHPVDFSYTRQFDLNDIRYLDLIYAPEENHFLATYPATELFIGNVAYFDGYPAALSGTLGFELVEDSRPDEMRIAYVIQF